MIRHRYGTLLTAGQHATSGDRVPAQSNTSGMVCGCEALVGAPWWQAARANASWNVTGLTALGLEAGGARSYLGAVWHALHSPNAAPEVLAPVPTNW